MSLVTRFALTAALLASTVGSSVVVAQSPSFQLEGSQLKLPGPVVFESGSDKIKSESESALGHVKAYLDDKSYITLMRIEAHTCLLYTSPSPRDRTRSRMPSSA